MLPVLVVSPLFASGPTGTITGTVTDRSGAVIPRARVVVINEETNAKREAETNEAGDYTVALLPPGRYRVAVESAGFHRSVFQGVGLDVDQTVRVDFALRIGAVTEEVRVNDTPPIVQTDTSALGQVVNNRLVQELPLNERNFLSFTLLVPGSQMPAQGSQNATQGGAISVNGAREQSNNFLLEGVDNNDPYINQYVALPSIDAIEEFKVQSSDYSAEYGHGSGAQVNVVLKSGTNQFHGALFEFFRNRWMDAKNFFDFPGCTATSPPGTCGAIPRFDRSQYGGTLGGPVFKDKTFFFMSYEGLHLRQATTREATVPSIPQWGAAEGLADALFGCPSNPSCQAGQNVYNLYPSANVGADLIDSNTFLSAPVIRNTENLVSVKVDEHASPADFVTLHYSLVDNNFFNPFDPVNAFTSLPGYGSYTLNHGQNAGIEYTRVFRSSVVNEFRLGFIRMRSTVLQQNHGVGINAQLGFPDVLTNPVDLGAP
ncbi:MAG: carboxypeptidase-like regulatory domain-containing protein, partial [Terracidiphilus sp.]